VAQSCEIHSAAALCVRLLMCACFFRWLRAQHDIRCRPALVALSATPEGSWAWKRAPEVAAPAQHTMSQPMEGASERRANRLPFSAGGIYSAAGGHPKKTRRAIGGSHRVRDLQYVLESTAPQRASNCRRLALGCGSGCGCGCGSGCGSGSGCGWCWCCARPSHPGTG
jgi:hypothetical protein